MNITNETVLISLPLPEFLENYKHRVLDHMEQYERSIVKVTRHIYRELIQNPSFFDALLTLLGFVVFVVLALRFLEYSRSASRGKPGIGLTTLRLELEKTRGELDNIRKLMNDKPIVSEAKPQTQVDSSGLVKKLTDQLNAKDNIIQKYEECLKSNTKLSGFFLDQFSLILEEIKKTKSSLKSSKRSKGSKKSDSLSKSKYQEIQVSAISHLRQGSAVEPIITDYKKKEETVEINGINHKSELAQSVKVDSDSPKSKATPVKSLEVSSMAETAASSQRKSPKSANKRPTPPIASPVTEVPKKADNVHKVAEVAVPIIEQMIQQHKQDKSPDVSPVRLEQTPPTKIEEAKPVEIPIPVMTPPVFNKPKTVPPPPGGNRPRPPPPVHNKPKEAIIPPASKPEESKTDAPSQNKQEAKIASQTDTKDVESAVTANVTTPSPPNKPILVPIPQQTQTPVEAPPKPAEPAFDVKPKMTPPPPGPARGGPPRPPPGRQNKTPPPPMNKQQSIELPQDINEQLLNFPESAHNVHQGLQEAKPVEVPASTSIAEQPEAESTKQTVEVPLPVQVPVPVASLEEKIEKPKFKPPPPPAGNRKPPPPPVRR